jgi:predicted small metal-binding protein
VISVPSPLPPSLLSDGPALRLLDIAIAAQGSQWKLSLDDEIRRYIRTVSGDWIARWNCSVYAATGVLDAVADHLESNPDLESLPSNFLEKIKQACEGMDPAGYLHTLAEMTRTLERQGVPEYWELPMGSWEFLQTFPHLFGLDAILMDEGDQEFTDVVRSVVASEHPYCHERAASYTTEAQRALVLFPGPDALKTRLSWATHSRLQEVIDTINEHMQREHS